MILVKRRLRVIVVLRGACFVHQHPWNWCLFHLWVLLTVSEIHVNVKFACILRIFIDEFHWKDVNERVIRRLLRVGVSRKLYSVITIESKPNYLMFIYHPILPHPWGKMGNLYIFEKLNLRIVNNKWMAKLFRTEYLGCLYVLL